MTPASIMNSLLAKFKLKFILILIAEIAFAMVIFNALSYWQETDMLASNSNAPELSAKALDGKVYQFPEFAQTSERTLVYFFAPWCKICHLSIGNLNLLREQLSEKELSIIIVALDWQSEDEIRNYMAEHELSFPVLLGDNNWMSYYKIKAFPSYYVLNNKAEILSRSMGYSSILGMLRRTL